MFLASILLGYNISDDLTFLGVKVQLIVWVP